MSEEVENVEVSAADESAVQEADPAVQDSGEQTIKAPAEEPVAPEPPAIDEPEQPVAPVADAPIPAAPTGSVSVWPFVAYDAVWLAYAAAVVWQFSTLPAAQAVFDSEFYPLAILGGLALAIAGPVLILTVWIASWKRSSAGKGSLLVSALVRGAVATAIGVSFWWGALLILDRLRLGRLL